LEIASEDISLQRASCCGVHPHVGAIHELPLRKDFACLRVVPPCGAEAGAPFIWAFLISLGENDFFSRLLKRLQKNRVMPESQNGKKQEI